MSEEQIKDMILKQCLELTTNNDFRPPISDYDGIDIDDVVRTCKQLQDKKTYLDLLKENQELKKQLEYLRSGEYYNQLRFERDMLQYVADNGKVSKEDKEFIDMTHRNTELLEVIEELREYIEDWLFDAGGNGASMTYEDINELLQILDKVKN